MKKQEEYAILKAMGEAIEKRQKVLRQEMLDSWAADGITSAEVDLNGRRLGKVTVKRSDTTAFAVVDEGEFAHFADERFTREVIHVDAAKLPPEVLQMLADTFDCVSASLETVDWRSSCVETPAGVMTTDGEPVPGVVAVHTPKRVLEWRKDPGISAEDVLVDAKQAAALPQVVGLLGEVSE